MLTQNEPKVCDSFKVAEAEGAVKAALEEKMILDALHIADRYAKANTASTQAVETKNSLLNFLVLIALAHGFKYEMEGPRRAILGTPFVPWVV